MLTAGVITHTQKTKDTFFLLQLEASYNYETKTSKPLLQLPIFEEEKIYHSRAKHAYVNSDKNEPFNMSSQTQ